MTPHLVLVSSHLVAALGFGPSVSTDVFVLYKFELDRILILVSLFGLV
jgi:hypothetical protein